MVKTIRTQTEYEIVINKSRFIGILVPVSDVEEVSLYLEEARELYPGATHYCYAYIIDALKKASDDGEPSKTAGMPILNVLEKNGLDHVLAIVVRYFGGIKLGAGGLVRAYSQSVVETLGQAQIVTKVKAPYYAFTFDYHFSRQMDYFFKSHQIDILIRDYQEQIRYECFILDETILEEINERFAGQINYQKLREDDVEIKGDDIG